jgi:ABC-type multidrug transport system permease subunit
MPGLGVSMCYNIVIPTVFYFASYIPLAYICNVQMIIYIKYGRWYIFPQGTKKIQ